MKTNLSFIKAARDKIQLLNQKLLPHKLDYVACSNGADVAKAIALGADAVQLGRPTLFGLAAAGQAGAEHALRLLGDDFGRCMALCGATDPRGLRGRVVPSDPFPDRGLLP